MPLGPGLDIFPEEYGRKMDFCVVEPNHVNLKGDFCNGGPQKERAVLGGGKEQSRHKDYTEKRTEQGPGCQHCGRYTTPKAEPKSHPHRLQELTQMLLTLEKPGVNLCMT